MLKYPSVAEDLWTFKYKRVMLSFDLLGAQFREKIFRLIDPWEFLFSVWFSWSISIIFEHVQISKRRRRPLYVLIQKSCVFLWSSWRSVSRKYISSHRSSCLLFFWFIDLRDLLLWIMNFGGSERIYEISVQNTSSRLCVAHCTLWQCIILVSLYRFRIIYFFQIIRGRFE